MFREITSGAFVSASFGLSESHCGSDAAALRTSAQSATATSYVINGSKTWISAADRAGVIIVWARHRKGRRRSRRGSPAFSSKAERTFCTSARRKTRWACARRRPARSPSKISRVPRRRPCSAAICSRWGSAVAMAALDGGRIGIASAGGGHRHRGARTQRKPSSMRTRSKGVRKADRRFRGAPLHARRLRHGAQPPRCCSRAARRRAERGRASPTRAKARWPSCLPARRPTRPAISPSRSTADMDISTEFPAERQLPRRAGDDDLRGD